MLGKIMNMIKSVTELFLIFFSFANVYSFLAAPSAFPVPFQPVFLSTFIIR